MNGAKQFTLLARTRMLETLLSFAVMVPLVLAWHTEGALLSLAATNLIVLAANAWMVRSLPPPIAGPTPPASQADRAALRTLLSFGAAALFTAGIGNGVGLLARRRIIAHLGLETSGLYQVAFSLTQTYLGLVLAAMSAYTFTAYRAVHTEPEKLRSEVNQTLRGAVLVIVPVIAGLLALRTLFIRALFSAEYVDAEAMLRIQLVGDLFKVVAWAIGLTIVASGRMRLHVLLEVILGSTWLLGVEVLTRTLGSLGPPVAFAANQVLMCIVYGAIAARLFGLRLERRNVVLLACSFALLVAINLASGLPLVVQVLGAAVGTSAWAWFNVQREEWLGLRRFVRTKWLQRMARLP